MLKTIIFPDIPHDLVSSGEIIVCCFQYGSLSIGIPGEASSIQANYHNPTESHVFTIKQITKSNDFSTVYALTNDGQLNFKKHHHQLQMTTVTPDLNTNVMLSAMPENQELIICKISGDELLIVSSSTTDELPVEQPPRQNSDGVLYIVENEFTPEEKTKVLLLQCLGENSEFIGLSLETSKKNGFSLGFLSTNHDMLLDRLACNRFSTISKPLGLRSGRQSRGGSKIERNVNGNNCSGGSEGNVQKQASLLSTSELIKRTSQQFKQGFTNVMVATFLGPDKAKFAPPEESSDSS